jgi:hypothetical protein
VSTTRSRVIALIAVGVLALGGAAIYLAVSRTHQDSVRSAASTATQVDVNSITNGPHIVFRNTNPRTGYGMTAMVSLANPSGPRAITETSCDRVYATTENYLCLSSSGSVLTTYAAQVLDAGLDDVQDLPLVGIPSRARLSRDGKLAATTSFATGDSYAAASFSTRTVISEVGGTSRPMNLEDFTLIHDGEHITPIDRNYWGVTFGADDDTFYATVQWSGHTWLVRGSVSHRTVVTLTRDAECPSLSPDGKQIVFKQRGNRPAGKWRLVRYDVATGRITPLTETRSVDDQVEWLDNAHVLYGLPRGGAEATADDVWEVPADGTGTPRVLIPQAWSPAVVQ